MEEYGIDYIPENESSGTVVYVAHNGSFSGSIVISDALRDETPSVIKYLKQKPHKDLYAFGRQRGGSSQNRKRRRFRPL